MAPDPTRAAAQGSKSLVRLAMVKSPSPFRSHKKGWELSAPQAIQPAQVVLTSEIRRPRQTQGGAR